MSKTVWEKMDKKGMKALMTFNDEYKDFLSASKTERTFTANAVAFAEANGFKGTF